MQDSQVIWARGFPWILEKWREIFWETALPPATPWGEGRYPLAGLTI